MAAVLEEEGSVDSIFSGSTVSINVNPDVGYISGDDLNSVSVFSNITPIGGEVCIRGEEHLLVEIQDPQPQTSSFRRATTSRDLSTSRVVVCVIRHYIHVQENEFRPEEILCFLCWRGGDTQRHNCVSEIIFEHRRGVEIIYHPLRCESCQSVLDQIIYANVCQLCRGS
jgi:hypothetical protein